MSMNLWERFAGYTAIYREATLRPMVLWRKPVAGLFENVGVVNQDQRESLSFSTCRGQIDWGILPRT